MHKCILLLSVILLISCHTSYDIINTRTEFIEIDSSFDYCSNPKTLAFIESQKQVLMHEMSIVLGSASETIINRERSFNPLANIIADLIKEEASSTIKKDIDFAVVNIGGLRCEIPQGNITLKQIHELLPFTNTLCVMNMNGAVVQELFEQIASLGGEGISKGTILTISPDGKLIDSKINGECIQPNHAYRVATIEYLAEGNDGMIAFKKATDKVFLENITLRELFICHH